MSALSLFDAGPPPPCPPRFNLANYVLQAGRATPEKTALTIVSDPNADDIDRWSYGRIEDAVRRTAASLRAEGLTRGARVALRLGNTAAFPIHFLATIAAGGIAVPTSAQLTEREFRALIDDMDARTAVISPELAVSLPQRVRCIEPAAPGAGAEPIEAFADTAAHDPAFMIYTSGASGAPKGVLHAQRSVWARRMMWQDWYGLSAADTMLHAGAFNWTYTLGTGLMDPWAAGASAIIYGGAAASGVWPLLCARLEPSILAAVPGIYRHILRQDGDLSSQLASLRHGLTAGERMPPELANAWHRRTGTRLYEALGMSEISTYISTPPGERVPDGSCGRPQRGRRVAILDPETGDPVPIGEEGVLAVSRRDPGLMLGYWNRPEETADSFRGEWFLTGDRARMDAAGNITYLGRADEVMTALGYRVAPQEVEQALAAHPAVAEIAVAELPVRPDLSVIAAFYVSAEPPDPEDLRTFAATRLAPYKCPREWVRVAELPRTPNGKLMRRALVEAHRRDRGG